LKRACSVRSSKSALSATGVLSSGAAVEAPSPPGSGGAGLGASMAP
jgi:hypothetical protein